MNCVHQSAEQEAAFTEPNDAGCPLCLRAQLAAEREKSAGLEREYRDLKSCMDQDESDDRLIRHPSADAMMRESLGQDLFNRLWGPGLEALGKVVDVALNREAAALAAQKAAEERLVLANAVIVAARARLEVWTRETYDALVGALRMYDAPQAPAAERKPKICAKHDTENCLVCAWDGSREPETGEK